MSAIRVLVLGVLREQSMHGYEVRQELESWGAEQWANIAYGSIYSALTKMAEEGLIEVADTHEPGSRPARTVYAITMRGRDEFQRLVRAFWWEHRPTIDPFQVALTFADCLPRDELLAALRHRASGIRAFLEAFPFVLRAKSAPGVPRHIAENLRLAAAHSETELRWIEDAIGKVEREELP